MINLINKIIEEVLWLIENVLFYENTDYKKRNDYKMKKMY